MHCSNTSGASGERLLFPHRDGSLRLLGSAYDLKATYGVGPMGEQLGPPLSTLKPVDTAAALGSGSTARPSLSQPSKGQGAPPYSGQRSHPLRSHPLALEWLPRD